MARLSEEQINQIRSKVDIVDVIGSYIPLTRKGKGYWCTCPFHDDTNPSMSVSQEKQIYKCFVCNAGGNVFSFIQNYEQVGFMEAVAKVAGTAGIELEVDVMPKARQVDPEQERLINVCKEMQEFTHYQLDTLSAASVKDYLHRRGLNEEIIQRFALGYNPEQDAVYKFLKAKKHTDEDILNAGVARMSSMGMKDVFSGRLTIPIHDIHGNTVGFSARRLKENEDAKYINTSETKIYHKGNLIFNYHRAKNEARKKNSAILVEGAMDVLAFEKIDMHNAIATLGTACTKEQIRLLKQLHVPIVVCYDGDEAGKNATYKFGKMAVEYQLDFEIMDNKTGLDPDEIIDVHGKDSLKTMVNRTISWIEFLFEYLSAQYNLNNYSQKKEFAVEMAAAINLLKDDFEKTNYFMRLRQLTDFDMQIQSTAQINSHNEQKTIKKSYVPFPKTGWMQAEQVILSQMLCGVSASNLFKEELGYLKDDTSSKLAMYIIDFYRTHKEMSVADLLTMIKEDSVKTALLNIANWDLAKDCIDLNLLRDAIRKVKACLLDDKILYINDKIKGLNDPLQKAALAGEKNALILKKHELMQEMTKETSN